MDINHAIRCPQNHSFRKKAWKEIWSMVNAGRFPCTYVVNKFRSGTEKWFMEGIVQWEGDIPPLRDTIGNTTFETFIDQQDIGWDQAIRVVLASIGVRQMHFIVKKEFSIMTQLSMIDGLASSLMNFGTLESGNGNHAIRSFMVSQTTNRSMYLAKDVDQIITQMYSQVDRGVSLSDKFFFQLPCQNRKSHNTIPEKLLWIKTVETAIWANNPGIDQDIGGGAPLCLAP